jgi:hypothetical protein
MALESVILSDRHTLVLEERAFREGALTEQDYSLRELGKPSPLFPNVAEQAAVDMISLYGTIVAKPRRFILERLNQFSNNEVIIHRPDTVRDALMSSRGYGRWNTEYHQLIMSRDQEGLEATINDATLEAQYLMRRDLRYILADANTIFSVSNERKSEDDSDVRVAHNAAGAFLSMHAYWLVDLFSQWFRHGSYNHYLTSSDFRKADLPKEIVGQFEHFLRSPRFEFYFQHLQDTFANLFDSAFLARASGIEMAYD